MDFVIHIQICDFFILLLRGLKGIVNVRLRFVLQEAQPTQLKPELEGTLAVIWCG